MDLEQRKKIARVLEIIAFFVFTIGRAFIFSPNDVKQYATTKMFQNARIYNIVSLLGISILLYGIELFFTMENCTKKQFMVRSAIIWMIVIAACLYLYFS